MQYQCMARERIRDSTMDKGTRNAALRPLYFSRRYRNRKVHTAAATARVRMMELQYRKVSP